MKKAIFLTLIIVLLVSNLMAAEKMRIAVMDLKAMDVSENTARAVSDIVRTELFNTGYFRIVERSEMDSILKEQGFQLSGCSDTECAVQVGKLLSARKMLVGSVSKLGNSFIINARIVDVEKGEMEFGEKAKAESESTLDQAVEVFAKKIAARIRASKNNVSSDEIPVEDASDTGGGSSWMKTGGLILMGAGLVSGGLSFYFNSKMNKAYDDYKALDGTDMALDDWDTEWDKVESAKTNRDMFMYIGIGAGAISAGLFIIDMLSDKGPEDTAYYQEQNKGLYFAWVPDYRLGYNLRW